MKLSELKEMCARKVADLPVYQYDRLGVLLRDDCVAAIRAIELPDEPDRFMEGIEYARKREGDVSAEFKNFHRALCQRFGYSHDDEDWKRDQVSLIEWIAKSWKRITTVHMEAQPDGTVTQVDPADVGMGTPEQMRYYHLGYADGDAARAAAIAAQPVLTECRHCGFKVALNESPVDAQPAPVLHPIKQVCMLRPDGVWYVLEIESVSSDGRMVVRAPVPDDVAKDAESQRKGEVK